MTQNARQLEVEVTRLKAALSYSDGLLLQADARADRADARATSAQEAADAAAAAACSCEIATRNDADALHVALTSSTSTVARLRRHVKVDGFIWAGQAVAGVIVLALHFC